MTSAAARSSTAALLESSFYAGFRADDTLVEIIPEFNHDGILSLSSSVSVGPFHAGLKTNKNIPLWMALFLQQRSLARIATPTWLSIDNLAHIIQFEKKEGILFDNLQQLPTNYYEISKRLTNCKMIDDADAIALLIQDLFEIRMDKLRQQFNKLLTEASDTDLLVEVNGIGTQELKLLQNYVTRALTDQYFLNQQITTETGAKATGTGTSSKEDVDKKDSTTMATDTAASSSTTTTTRRSIRRFR